MLEIKNISKAYNRQGKDFFAVKDVNLNILDGDFVHIIGRSGSGKSTLLNIVAGLLSADKSPATIFNRVDFPLPLLPIIWTKSPSKIFKFVSLTAKKSFPCLL